MTSADGPRAIRAWLSWVAIQTSDQAEVITHPGVTNLRRTSWASGTELINDIAHGEAGRLSTVVITPAIEGWTLVVGPWCWLPFLWTSCPLSTRCPTLLSLSKRASPDAPEERWHRRSCYYARRPVDRRPGVRTILSQVGYKASPPARCFTVLASRKPAAAPTPPEAPGLPGWSASVSAGRTPHANPSRHSHSYRVPTSSMMPRRRRSFAA